MKKIMLHSYTIASFISFWLFGCSMRWVNKDIKHIDVSVEIIKCEKASYHLFPVKNEVMQEYFYKDYSDCERSKSCDFSRSRNFNPEMISYVVDVNKNSRIDYFYKCMKKGGWYRETKWF